MGNRAAKVWGFIRWILTPEELAQEGPESPANRPSLLRWVLSSESLDQDHPKNDDRPNP